MRYKQETNLRDPEGLLKSAIEARSCCNEYWDMNIARCTLQGVRRKQRRNRAAIMLAAFSLFSMSLIFRNNDVESGLFALSEMIAPGSQPHDPLQILQPAISEDMDLLIQVAARE